MWLSVILNMNNIINESKNMILSVVFSFRNEEEVLPELIKRTRDVLNQEQEKAGISSYELIFVNDSSTDNSLKILEEHLRDHSDIRIINMSRCFGVSPCVLAGMRHSSGDVVVYMDADLQDPPEVIPRMLEAFKSEKNVDVVHTFRRSRKGESKVKLFITKIGYQLLRKITSLHLPAEVGDFKLLSRRAVNHLVKFKEKHPYMRGLVCWIGFKQKTISYDRDARFAGETKFRIFSLPVISNFVDSAMISFSSAPLKLASVLGLLAIFVDLIFVAHVFLEKIQGKAIPGWTAIMIVILFLGGVQLFCVGIMGLYLNAVHEENRNRPNYIVESLVGFPE